MRGINCGREAPASQTEVVRRPNMKESIAVEPPQKRKWTVSVREIFAVHVPRLDISEAVGQVYGNNDSKLRIRFLSRQYI